MTSYIALLRGVNVGGKRKVPMTELQAAFVAMGFADARTLLNSGNVVFRADKSLTPPALEAFLEAEAARRLGFARAEIDGFMRDAGLETLVGQDLMPGPDEADKFTVSLWTARDRRSLADTPIPLRQDVA